MLSKRHATALASPAARTAAASTRCRWCALACVTDTSAARTATAAAAAAAADQALSGEHIERGAQRKE